jgi:hypothetical protein
MWAGRVLGGAVGELFGPEAVPLGAWLGGRGGAMAGRALGEALSSYMESANDNAQAKTKDKDAAVPCVNCGDIDCFNPPPDADDKLKEEFRRQLKEQQDTINNMDPDKLLENMAKYAKNKRPSNDASDRRTARNDYVRDRTRALEKKYAAEGRNDYKSAAAADVAEELANLNATHTLDLVAGGDGSISGMGNATVNKSMGAQWKGKRAGQLKKYAENARDQKKKMNVKLSECSDKNGSDAKDGGNDSNSDSGSGSGNSISKTPMS